MSDLDLRVLLALERLELNLFRGRSPIDDRPRIFGGQVIAQALLAAYETVTDRVCHSLHAYFIRPGDPRIPIIYEVDRARDGASFTTRRVIAIQNGRQIFNMAASFQQPEGGVEHQDAMPQGLPGPDGFPTLAELETNYLAKQAPPRSELRGPDPFDMRFVEPSPEDFLQKPQPARQRAWLRARCELGDDPRWHQVALAYASDLWFLAAGLQPHQIHWAMPNVMIASLDHAIWFHRPSDMTEWHLYDMQSPSASGARGFNLGAVFSPDGRLIASTAQEGLMRISAAD